MRNARFFKLVEPVDHRAWLFDVEEPKPLSALQESNFTWVTKDTINGCIYLQALIQEKLLPPRVINERLAAHVKDRDVTRRERLEIKEQIRVDLLAQAFTQSRKITGFLDLANGWFVVDARTDKDCDWFTAQLRDKLGTFPIKPADKELPLTGWWEEMPDRITMGEKITLRLPKDPTVRTSHSYRSSCQVEIQQAIDEGMVIDKMEIVFDELFSAVLDRFGVLRSIKYTIDPADEYVVTGALRDWVEYHVNPANKE